MEKVKLWHVLVGLFAALFLFINPITRPMIVWLLPLGSGWDDLVIIVLLVLIGVGIWTGLWVRTFAYLRKKRGLS